MKLVYFTAIKKTQHYVEEHEGEVPWSEVVAVIFQAAKNMRKKGEKLEIETDSYYLLLELKENILYVINAKRKG